MIEIIQLGPVSEIRMSHPPANALSPGLIRALGDSLSEVIEGGASAIVLSGLPGMFSAGLDVPTLVQLHRDGVRDAWSGFHAIMSTLATSPIPTVAAITGHAPAGGAVISLFTDYRVMAEGPYKIGLNEVEVGIILPPFMVAALERLVGPHRAATLVTAATMVRSEEAYRIGLVDELAPVDEVVDRSLARCQRLLCLPQKAMSKTRANARRDLVEILESAGESYLDELVDLWFSDETQAALTALVKRLQKN